MRPRERGSGQSDLFKAQLDQVVDTDRPYLRRTSGIGI